MAASMVSKSASSLFEFGQPQSSQQALSVAHLVNPTPSTTPLLPPPFQFASFPFPSPTSDQDKIKQLQQIILQETQLIKELSKTYEPQIKEILRKKEEAISLILCDSSTTSATIVTTKPPVAVEQPAAPRSPAFGTVALQIVQQPPEVAVSNRYLTPAPTVQVISSTPRTNLHVSASLVHGTTEVELIKTVDGRHDVLQGIKKIVVDATGKIAFNKLKIVEVSSKHKHQAFCLIFSLEEMVQGRKRVLAQVKTAPFHVQSRPNKRKLSSAPSSPLPDSGSQTPNMKRIKSAETISSNELSASDDSDEDYDPAKASSNENSSHDYNYIDITDLLKLPQKEAAKRLGISESMLCKRFKECTRRKWPYRYLRKIEKVINILNLHKTDGSIPKEDRDKLEKLLKEREECLRPVKIRITAYDKLTSTNERPEQEASPNATNNASLSAEDEDEDEIPDDILETLGKLKSSPPRL